MRNMVMVMVNVMLGVMLLIILMALHGRENRSMEIQSNLSSAVEETVEQLSASKSYVIADKNEYLADFMESLAAFLDTQSDITVEVMEADETKGILSLRVTEEFRHTNGKKGSVSCERTVILNREEEIPQQWYRVRFYRSKEDMAQDANCYKTYRLLEGSMVAMPVNPTGNKTFSCWKDVNDYIADFSIPVTRDLVYYAAWN